MFGFEGVVKLSCQNTKQELTLHKQYLDFGVV